MARRIVRFVRANAIAVLALVVAMSGSAAAAAFVVSKNSQVGPNTISGHAPPTGDHANLVTGSVNSQDLANGTVKPADLAPPPAWDGLANVFSVFGCHPGGSGPDFWTDFGSGYTAFGFRKDASGVVHLRGALACASAATLAASQPMLRLRPAFCPKANEVFPVATGNGSGTFAMSVVEVDAVPPSDNSCEVQIGPGAMTGFVSLSGIEYDTRS
jgi:hypothetical protein